MVGQLRQVVYVIDELERAGHNINKPMSLAMLKFLLEEAIEGGKAGTCESKPSH